jgi:dihydropteroate synthase
MIAQDISESAMREVREFSLSLPRGDTLEIGEGRRALVMGILNVTPDSFSDGGAFNNPDRAVAHGIEMADEGADIIDVGGESTRPGSARVSPRDQIARVLPVIERLSAKTKTPISIDTTLAEVAVKALDAGAQIVNDISALREDPKMASLIAERKNPVILMHMRGSPCDMQVNPTYRNVVAEVAAFLRERVTAAVEAGIQRTQILVDPGFGFGKLFEHNMALLRRLDALRDIGCPVLVGTSRKAMIGHVLNIAPEDRLYGTLATVAAAIERGADVVRVHDVRPALHVAKMIAAIQGRNWN